MELARLRAELAKTKMELAIIKKSGSVLRAGSDVKDAWIDRNRGHWPVSVLCEQLDLSVSGYHQYVLRDSVNGRKPGRNGLSNDALLAHPRPGQG